MKSLAILAAAVCVLIAGAFTARAAPRPAAGVQPSSITLSLPLGATRGALREMRSIRIPLQTGTNATATPTSTSGAVTATPTATVPAGTPTPTPTTGPSYPDPVTILQNFAQVYSAIKTAHIELKTVAEKPNVEKLTLDGIGDATCTGPAMQLKVKGSDVLEGTNQQQSVTVTFVQVTQKVKNKKTLLTEAKQTGKNKKWVKVKDPNNVVILSFPYPISNPLACPAAVSTGTGTGTGSGITDVSKDVVNMGPTTFQGHDVWHIHFIDVRTDSQGNSIELVDDFFIDQQHFLPWDLQQIYDDTADGITILEEQVTTKIGEKVKVTYHKLGTT